MPTVATSIAILLIAILLIVAYGLWHARRWSWAPTLLGGMTAIWVGWALASDVDPFGGGETERTVTLAETRWRCATWSEHEVPTLVVISPKVMIPTTRRERRCDRYERR